MSDNLAISNRLREFGLRKYRSMAEFGRALDMSPQSLNKYLSGETRIGATIRERLVKLGCDIEWLMTGRETLIEDKIEDGTLHFRSNPGPSEELNKRAHRLLQKMKEHPNGDWALIEKIINDVLDGK